VCEVRDRGELDIKVLERGRAPQTGRDDRCVQARSTALGVEPRPFYPEPSRFAWSGRLAPPRGRLVTTARRVRATMRSMARIGWVGRSLARMGMLGAVGAVVAVAATPVAAHGPVPDAPPTAGSLLL